MPKRWGLDPVCLPVSPLVHWWVSRESNPVFHRVRMTAYHLPRDPLVEHLGIEPSTASVSERLEQTSHACSVVGRPGIEPGHYAYKTL